MSKPITPIDVLVDLGTAWHADRRHDGRFKDCFRWGCTESYDAITELKEARQRQATKDSLLQFQFEFYTGSYRVFNYQYPWFKGLEEGQHDDLLFAFIANSLGRNDALRGD